MEITVLDADDNRYDPILHSITEEHDRFVFIVEHTDLPAFSVGDRALFFLASETHAEADPAEVVRKRDAMETVVGECLLELTDATYSWEISDVTAVSEVLAAEDYRPLSG